MKIPLIGAAWLGLWLAAFPAFAQAPGTSGVRPGDGTPNTAPPTPPTPAASPDEIAHQAMVEEQERRDREEQAERDRDDQG